MTTRALLRPKDEADSPRNLRKTDADRLQKGDFSDIEIDDSENEDESGEILEDEIRRFCWNRFKKCCVNDKTDSSTDSDVSYVPHTLKKLMKKVGTKKPSGCHQKPKSRSMNRSRKSSHEKNRGTLSKQLSTSDSKPKPKYDMAKTIESSRKRFPLKEEVAIQKSAASKSDSRDIRDTGNRRSLQGASTILAMSSKFQIPFSGDGNKPRKSAVEILLDPNIDQKEAERMVAEMHKQARDLRAEELEGYLYEVRKAIRKLDIEEGLADEDDDDLADLSPELDESNDEVVESAGKMDAVAMRTMLTALAGREAKEDAVASVANVGASWRTVPHDQLNSCLSMDPELLGDHRRRVKRNYEEFDKVYQPRKKGDSISKQPPMEENEDVFSIPSEKPSKPEKPPDIKDELIDDEPINIAELTREQMLEIHDKIGPWVLHHTKKLDKFIQSRKYTPQYLLNHWNGELSDDDSEVDFEKHRSAWKKKLEDRENPGEGQESQPPAIPPEDRVPTLQENNWFLFPTPMTRSYSTETDEQGWDGQRTTPFSQVAMEGLVKYLRRQQEAEKSQKFLRENPWPPPSRYPPEIKPEPEVKHMGSEVHDEEEEDVK